MSQWSIRVDGADSRYVLVFDNADRQEKKTQSILPFFLSLSPCIVAFFAWGCCARIFIGDAFCFTDDTICRTREKILDAGDENNKRKPARDDPG